MLENVFYINLEERKDRKEWMEKELKLMGWKYERYPAIKCKSGAVGCSLSHLGLLKRARDEKLDYIVILEDDIHFTKKEWINERIKEIFERGEEYDVLYLCANVRDHNVKMYSKNLVRVVSCIATTGYIVNRDYYDKIIENIEKNVKKLIMEPRRVNRYAIDIGYQELQLEDKFVMIYPKTVGSIVSYSDILNREVDYNKLLMGS